MKPRFLLILGFAFGAGAALAQSQGTQGAAPDSKPSDPSANERLQVSLKRNGPAVKDQGEATHTLKVSGPLVQPFKTGQPSSTPRRLLELVNPFAPTDQKPASETRTRGISTRSWTTVAGWAPGGSAFPNEVTHEPQMTFISVSRKGP